MLKPGSSKWLLSKIMVATCCFAELSMAVFLSSAFCPFSVIFFGKPSIQASRSKYPNVTPDMVTASKAILIQACRRLQASSMCFSIIWHWNSWHTFVSHTCAINTCFRQNGQVSERTSFVNRFRSIASLPIRKVPSTRSWSNSVTGFLFPVATDNRFLAEVGNNLSRSSFRIPDSSRTTWKLSSSPSQSRPIEELIRGFTAITSEVVFRWELIQTGRNALMLYLWRVGGRFTST